MFPIVSGRYKCNDCEEAIGFDLCGECYNTFSKLPGRFNQQHTLEHKFEFVNSDLIRNIMRRLVSEHFEDSSAPVLSDDASEDLKDGHPSHAPSDDTPENQEGDSHSTTQSLVVSYNFTSATQIHEWNVQTKLPHETTYLDVRNATDGWNTIRDMVVHGAPAIAISAALSLAVEVFNMELFVGTSENASSFLFNKLDYLVSRDSKYVFQAYIEFAETMLEDDVASNKAIGSYGASFIKNALKDSKNISILTHCNTGSLATTGYGIALGVIRALHTDGVLEKAFCTETQPFD
ncbi:hypothetical protein IFM89_006057 [Coptis chinensis]|uniref:ZZ-type domain-containing protein n=1 Tax=Coptis chinensis TaxID=261450 RepID=A0A835H335_9MAGN|nr:hypothetical protein IFM89_006057 [Coptis chinensis]